MFARGSPGNQQAQKNNESKEKTWLESKAAIVQRTRSSNNSENWCTMKLFLKGFNLPSFLFSIQKTARFFRECNQKYQTKIQNNGLYLTPLRKCSDDGMF